MSLGGSGVSIGGVGSLRAQQFPKRAAKLSTKHLPFLGRLGWSTFSAQGSKDLGKGLLEMACAPDGITEAKRGTVNVAFFFGG